MRPVLMRNTAVIIEKMRAPLVVRVAIEFAVQFAVGRPIGIAIAARIKRPP